MANGVEERAARPRARWVRRLGGVLLAAAVLLLIVLAMAWSERKPIATDIVTRELQRRGVPARFRIVSIGPRTQRIADLVIGDPAHPDLTARRAEIAIAIGLSGPEVVALRAEGVRLRARLSGGRLSLGAVDRLLPSPSAAARPLTLPAISLSLRDARVRLETGYGLLGIAIEGEGKLQDGFSGRAAIVSRTLSIAGCRAQEVRAILDVAIANRAPLIDGPVRASAARCGSAVAEQPAIALDARLAAAFDHWHGGARIEAAALRVPGASVAAPMVQIGFDGDRAATRGGIDAESATFNAPWARADATTFSGRFIVAPGERRLVGHADLRHLAAAEPAVARLRAIGAAVRSTPPGPVVAELAAAATDAVRDADAAFDLALLERAAAGAALEIERLSVASASGARVRFDGGIGLRLPAMQARIEGRAVAGGGGLPEASADIRQPKPGGPIGARVTIAAMQAGGARVVPGPISLASDPAGGVRFAAPLRLDGAIGGNGRIEALSATIAGDYRGGVLRIGETCQQVAFDMLRIASFRLGRTTRAVCPIGAAMIEADARGLRGGVRTDAIALSGAIGGTPLAIAARDLAARLPEARLVGHGLRVRLGAGADPTTLTAATLDGSAADAGVAGDFTGAGGTIADLPFVFSDAAGRWRYRDALIVQAHARVADRVADARFHPLAVPDFSLRLAANAIVAGGHLAEPRSGTTLARVDIEHDLATAAGHARIDVPGLTFGPRLQPEAITPLTLGVVANVAGRIEGSGVVRWSGGGVTSEGAFSTDKLDLAAAFGQVNGISGTIRFDDLIGLTTPPGQEAHIASINPGIEVADGVIRYQLLAGRRIGIESGHWPFAGGTLTLAPTVLDFADAAVRHLTLAVAGLDGAKFIDQMKFENIAATGLFDGTLPLVFDKDGGRIVAGTLVARPPGGTISYVGDVSNAQLGTFGKLAFDALKSLRYKTLAIALDGSLDGEVVSQIKVNGVNQQPVGAHVGPTSKQLTGLPFRFNITIKAPFRGLMNSARTFADPSSLIRAQPTPAPAPVQPK